MKRSSGLVYSSETGAVAQRITIWHWNASPSLHYVELLSERSCRVLLLLSGSFCISPLNEHGGNKDAHIFRLT